MSVVQINRKEEGNCTVLFFPSRFGVKKKKPWPKKVIIEPLKVCIFSNFSSDTKFDWRFFFFTPPDPKGKKNRKIGLQRGREEIVCGYREKIKPYPFGWGAGGRKCRSWVLFPESRTMVRKMILFFPCNFTNFFTEMKNGSIIYLKPNMI